MVFEDSFVTALGGANFKAVEPQLAQLDKHLTLRTFIDGFVLSDTDRKIWTALRTNKVTIGIVRKGAFANLTRWFSFLEEKYPELYVKPKSGEDESKAKKDGQSKAGSAYNMSLPNTEDGVVTRFPPEPSYVHLLALNRYT